MCHNWLSGFSQDYVQSQSDWNPQLIWVWVELVATEYSDHAIILMSVGLIHIYLLKALLDRK